MSESAATPFADGKAADALRTIGEVANGLGIRQHVLRYWEEQFPMLKPLKRSGGRRYYRAEDIQLVVEIDRLVHREGYTLKGAKKALLGGSGGSAAPARASTEPTPAASVPAAAATDVTSNFAYRARLISLRTTLVNALHEA